MIELTEEEFNIAIENAVKGGKIVGEEYMIKGFLSLTNILRSKGLNNFDLLADMFNQYSEKSGHSIFVNLDGDFELQSKVENDG